MVKQYAQGTEQLCNLGNMTHVLPTPMLSVLARMRKKHSILSSLNSLLKDASCNAKPDRGQVTSVMFDGLLRPFFALGSEKQILNTVT